MAKNYKETPYWWYVAVLVISFVLGIIVIVTDHISLPIWAYIVALLLGIFIAPLVRILEFSICLQIAFSDATAEHPTLFSLRQWYCHEQPVENAGGLADPWTPRW